MKWSHASRLWLAPWFHPVTAFDEELFCIYADGSGTPADVCDRYQLYSIQPRLWVVIRNLDLSAPLQVRGSNAGIYQLLGLIDSFDGSEVPLEQSAQLDGNGGGTSDLFLGINTALAKNFVFFEP